ncbi:MAG: FAD-dependent oxidoreductase, partial [Pedobacter sp.]|nr:FAD-dependent oxidoreductase [Pedobacter sp.]
QIADIQRYLTTYVPGFEEAHFTKMAPFIGIRETRRIVGKYVLTSNDILGCKRFDDSIAVASYPLDIHHPEGGGCTLTWCGDCYDIPYRSLLPQKIENLLVAGRCISTTHEAMSAIRVMAPCMAMGEAAGRAAKLAIRNQVVPADLDVQLLREELLAKGAYLNPTVEVPQD